MKNRDEHADAIKLIETVLSFIEKNELTELSIKEWIIKLEEKSENDILLKSFIKNKFDTGKYPRLKITFSNEEIEELNSISNISEELSKNVNNSKDLYLKLLYSIAWKQGNLTKLNSIINGITDKSNNHKTGTVFNAFGRHLRDRSNPIIDQHVIRAFLVIENIEKNTTENILDIR